MFRQENGVLYKKLKAIFDPAEEATFNLLNASALHSRLKRRGETVTEHEVTVEEMRKPRVDAFSEALALISELPREEMIAVAAYYAWRLFASQRQGKKDFQKRMDLNAKNASLFNAYLDAKHSLNTASQARRKGAVNKLANDPKQKDKATVRECWDEWKNSPTDHQGQPKYKSNEAFARDMLKFENLESTQTITRWCRQWEKERSIQQAK